MAETEKEQVKEALVTPLGQAWRRLFSDQEYVAAVIDDPMAATAEYGLSEEEAEELRTDAYALEGEVAGFGVRTLSSSALGDLTGMMRTPRRIGLPSNAYKIYCLTCVDVDWCQEL